MTDIHHRKIPVHLHTSALATHISQYSPQLHCGVMIIIRWSEKSSPQSSRVSTHPTRFRKVVEWTMSLAYRCLSFALLSLHIACKNIYTYIYTYTLEGLIVQNLSLLLSLPPMLITPTPYPLSPPHAQVCYWWIPSMATSSTSSPHPPWGWRPCTRPSVSSSTCLVPCRDSGFR